MNKDILFLDDEEISDSDLNACVQEWQLQQLKEKLDKILRLVKARMPKEKASKIRQKGIKQDIDNNAPFWKWFYSVGRK